jgi:hypothetical protein
MNKQINNARTSSFTLKPIISKPTFKINCSSMFIWLALALEAAANFRLLISQ